MDEIFHRVRRVVAAEWQIDEAEVTFDTEFEELGTDSFELLELHMALEEEFDMEIPDEDAGFKSVGQVVNYIDAMMREG